MNITSKNKIMLQHGQNFPHINFEILERITDKHKKKLLLSEETCERSSQNKSVMLRVKVEIDQIDKMPKIKVQSKALETSNVEMNVENETTSLISVT
jgi:hypothetical protein